MDYLEKSLSGKSISFYSVEEELLIDEFNPWINRAKSFNNSIDAIESGVFNAGGTQKDLWIDVHQTINRNELNKLIKFLTKCFGNKIWQNLDYKIIGQYNLDNCSLLSKKCLLVFGKIANKNFMLNHKYILITLEKEFKIGIINALISNKDYRNSLNPSAEEQFSTFSFKELYNTHKNIDFNLNYILR